MSHCAPEATLKPKRFEFTVVTDVFVAHRDVQNPLSPVHTVTENGTVAEKCDCCRKRQKTVTKGRQSPNSATVALFCDSRRFRRQIVAEIGDSVDVSS